MPTDPLLSTPPTRSLRPLATRRHPLHTLRRPTLTRPSGHAHPCAIQTGPSSAVTSTQARVERRADQRVAQHAARMQDVQLARRRLYGNRVRYATLHLAGLAGMQPRTSKAWG